MKEGLQLLKTQPFSGCYHLLFKQSERDKRRMLRCWASTPPSAPPCVLCAAAMQWQSFRFGDGGDGGAATLIMVELCRDVLGLQMGIACPQPFPSVGEVLYLFSYCV